MDMTSISFFIPGPPRGKGRPRFTRYGQTYTDDKTRAYEAAILDAFQRAEGRFYAEKGEAVGLDVLIRMPVPRSWPKKRQQDACDGQLLPLTKPDIDNVCKAVLDALNGHAWKDDAQVARMDVRKQYAMPDMVGVVVFMRKISG